MGTRLTRFALPLVLVFVVSGGVATAAPATPTVTVKAAQTTGYGSLLVSSTGMSLYHLTSEKAGSIGCKGACVKIWPPLLLSAGAKPLAGSGAHSSKLGTIKRPDGHVQVTYNGLALYRYAQDKKPGDVNGQELQGIWFAVTPAGKLAKTPASGSTPPTQTVPTSTDPGYGYGSGY